MLEAQVMSFLPNLDHTKTLEVINNALKTQLEVGKGKSASPILARIYEEKGHILRLLGGSVMETNDYNIQALQCFHSALAVISMTQEQFRKEISEQMIV